MPWWRLKHSFSQMSVTLLSISSWHLLSTEHTNFLSCNLQNFLFPTIRSRLLCLTRREHWPTANLRWPMWCCLWQRGCVPISYLQPSWVWPSGAVSTHWVWLSLSLPEKLVVVTICIYIIRSATWTLLPWSRQYGIYSLIPKLFFVPEFGNETSKHVIYRLAYYNCFGHDVPQCALHMAASCIFLSCTGAGR